MKFLRIALPILMICLALTMQGCGGASWSVDFTTAADVDDWEKKERFAPWEGELHGTDGLWLDGRVFIAPVGFDKDFTLEVVFGIADSCIVPAIGFSFLYSEAYPFEWISFSFQNVGDPVNEMYAVSENDPYRPMLSESGFLGFVLGGENTFKLKKSGNNLKAYLNDNNYYNGNYTSYSFDVLFPSLTVDQQDYSYDVFIRSISVEFSGSVYTWH